MTSLTVVVKVGTSSLTDDHGAIRPEAIGKLCHEVADVRASGHRVVVVTSGAVAAGVAALGLSQRPTDIGVLQALSAVGQSRLMAVYNASLAERGLVGAQVLLVPHDFFDRRQYLHARETLARLLELGVVPIINENDAIANDELRFGDNDRLAALVAQSIAADRLVLLTDMAGLFTADPRLDPTATLVEVVEESDDLAVQVGGAGSARGSGGMASKLAAARMASWSGVTAVIARADRPDVLADAVDGVIGVGTIFRPQQRRLSARKLWIAFAVAAAGRVVVDDGARSAVCEHGRSLLAAGVRDVVGEFGEADAVEIVGPDGAVFARGLSALSAVSLRHVAGRRTDELPEGTPREVIHRDDLVVLS
jgi:glutamate 5-kinase